MIRLIPWREMEDRQVGVVVGAAVGFEGCWVQVSKSEIGKFLEFHFTYCCKVFPKVIYNNMATGYRQPSEVSDMVDCVYLN